jgi:D-tyrosyl-tRNA(Tyr) deacylase
MRAVVQRVSEASVTVAGEVTGQIGRGFLVLLGIAADDSEKDVVWIAEKIAGLRVFEDAEGRMNLSLGDVSGAVLLVSQFTLYGDCRKGRRPSFVEAARPEVALPLYQSDVRLLNDGPVTLLLDSRRQF